MNELLHQQIEKHPYPLFFATISGAHLYGFPSPDSDYDLRGVYLLPLREVVGMFPLTETLDTSEIVEGVQIDFVAHDAKKFFELVLRKNGLVLENIFSPLVVHTTPEHEELKAIAQTCITKNHVHHYLGFARSQWELFNKNQPPRVKPLLYVSRVLLTGIYLMQTGNIEANLLHLNTHFNLPYVPELVERKLTGEEKSTLNNADLAFHTREYERLYQQLETAYEQSHLPDDISISSKSALNGLLVRLRLT